MATLRDFVNISYIVTTLADLEGRYQRSPGEQAVPPEWEERFIAAEGQLRLLTDAGMDTLVDGDSGSEEYTEVAELAPAAVEVLDSACEGVLCAVLFERGGP